MSLIDAERTSLASKCAPPEPKCAPLLPECAPSADAAARVLAPYAPLKLHDLKADTNPNVPWLWDGYLAPGAVTLLTGLWKSGKTTLLSVLLDRLREGGVLAGRPVRPGRAIVLSEEGKVHWRMRAEKWLFGDHITWLCRPFRSKPRFDDWLQLLNRCAALRQEGALDLLVIDPLAVFLPGRDENSAALMLEALNPLQALTSQGASVLVTHHPRKNSSLPGLSSRGTGALPGWVDILIEMERFDPADDLDRRRRLRALSRFDQTPIHSIVELNLAGTDYSHLGDFAQTECLDGWERVRRFLENAPCKLSRAEIIEDWPAEDRPVPAESSLRRWLDKAFADGRVAREGPGTRKHPHLFWLPGREKEWPDDDPLWFLKEEQEDIDFVKVEKENIRQERRKRARE